MRIGNPPALISARESLLPIWALLVNASQRSPFSLWCPKSQFMEAKKIVFKKKRRSNYRRNGGFRHRLTRLRILSVNGIAPGGEGA